MQKTNQKEFRVEKAIRKKLANYISNGKVKIINLTVGLIKKVQYRYIFNKTSQYFPKLFQSGNVKTELDLSNYAQKLI